MKKKVCKLKFTAIAIAVALTIPYVTPASAVEPSVNNCATEEAEVEAGFSSATSAFTEYAHGALGFFYFTLKMLNSGFAKIPKMPMCHFIKDMGMKPDLNALPFDKTETFENMSVRLLVEAPSESWAISLGYAAKATVTINATMFMIMYWGGSQEDSKGFMIQAANGFNPSEKSPLYLQWDRTAETQFVKVFATRYSSSYLGSTNDGAIYGKATYNKTTKELTSQVVMAMKGASAVGCFKSLGSGTKDSTIKLALPSAFGQNGIASGDAAYSATNDAGMSVISLVDSKTTQVGDQTLSTMTVSFDKSCDAIENADDPGALLAGGDVSASAEPSTIFP
jgi:hypothetical protein